MSNVKNDKEAKEKAKASLTLNKVKPFANPSPQTARDALKINVFRKNVESFSTHDFYKQKSGVF